jgi:hypothetical protein
MTRSRTPTDLRRLLAQLVRAIPKIASTFGQPSRQASASGVTQGRSVVASKGSRLPEVAVKARRKRGNIDRQNDQTRDGEQRKPRLHSRSVARTHNSVWGVLGGPKSTRLDALVQDE